MATASGWGNGNSFNVTWSSATTSTSYPAQALPNGPITLTSTPPPRKRTPMEWLEDEVERICAVTREGLPA